MLWTNRVLNIYLEFILSERDFLNTRTKMTNFKKKNLILGENYFNYKKKFIN